MRDVLFTLVIAGLIPVILWRAHIGVLAWVWLGVMNPHRLTYGFAMDVNWAVVIAAVTILSLLLSKDTRRPPLSSIVILMTLFVAWTGVTTMFALVPERSFDLWSNLCKTTFFAFLIPMLFHTRERIRQVIWVIVLSIGYYGGKGGLWILLTGGDERVFGPLASYIEDNNALAVAVVMTIPLCRYLQVTAPDRWVKRGLLLLMVLCGVAVIGSYSRGAFLAVVAMLAFLWWKGRGKFVGLAVILVAGTLTLAFMPDKWMERMETLQEFENDEGSSMARLNSWATMLNIARDRPLVGGGFEVATREVYDRYSPDKWRIPHVAHSIYFQALGEHGFVGFALYFGMLFAVWRKASRLIRLTRDRPEIRWAGDFAAMLQVSMIGFGVGGAFLSLVNFDVPYYLAMLLVSTVAIVERGAGAARSDPAGQRRANVPPVEASVKPPLARGPRPGIGASRT